MGRTLPIIPPFPKDWSDKQKYEATIKMLEAHKRKVQKDIDTSVSFIGGLTIWLAISLIVYLTIRVSI